MSFFDIIGFGKNSSCGADEGEVFDRKLFAAKHIKSGVNLKTLHVEVKKSTHKKSYINAESADIHTHKGVIEGGDVNIKRLVGGKVIADTIVVDFMENGTIEGNYIHIKKLGSGNSITSSGIVEIDSIEGEKNTITIKPLFDIEKYNILSVLYEKIMFYKKEFESTSKILEEKRLEVESQISNAKVCRAKINLSKEDGIIPDTNLMVEAREFDILSREYQKLVNMTESLREHMDVVIEEFKAYIKWSGFSCDEKVICDSSWTANNKISFVLPKHNLSYNPSKGENAHEIYLWYNCELLLDAQGEFRVKINNKES
ncbi:MAG: hypothetical protein LBC08_00110 [Campylobacteraceae bacterium]|jgi:hypothetical protein|nr:hypothetical protein [Campylobacteraceae bacterium]